MECVEKPDILRQGPCFEGSLRDAQDKFDRQAFQFRHLLADHQDRKSVV